MKLSDEAIQEFQALHEKRFGFRPSREQAEHDLLLLMKVVSAIQPLKRCTTEVT